MRRPYFITLTTSAPFSSTMWPARPQQMRGCACQQDGIPVTFSNDAEALGALESGVVIVDHKHWGRLRVAGEDRLSFLHGQSTADFLAMQPGRGCSTVSSQMLPSPLPLCH